jgi:hypothetical protein
MAKHFLYLTNERLTCLLWRGGRFVAKDTFPARNPYSLEFERYLARYRHVPAYLVLDLTEEDFRVETVPHLRGSDQTSVLTRKLGQVYRNTPYRHALIQGRETEGRRDDRVLYHGISNPDLVKPWLDTLAKLHIPLEGIYSAPVLSGQLLKTLDVFFPHTLLVSLLSGDGLRQTYFHNKQVKFSRLTPLEVQGETPFGQQVAEETSRTWQYLDSLRYFSADDTLEVCLLVHPKDRKEVSDAIRDYPLLQHRILDTDEVSKAVGLKPPPLDSYAEEIFAHLFASTRLENHFAELGATRQARLRKRGFAIHALNLAILAGAMGTAGVMFWQALKLDRAVDARDKQTADLTNRYRNMISQGGAKQISSDTSRDTAALFRTHLQPLPEPVTLLQDVSRAFARFPQIRLEQLAWLSSNDEKANPVLTPTQSRVAAVKSETKAAAVASPVGTAAALADLANPPLPGNKYQILLLEVATGPFVGDYRRLLGDAERFVATLNQTPGVKATLHVPPLDVRSAAGIKATLAASGETHEEGRYVVRVSRDMVPAAAKKS